MSDNQQPGRVFGRNAAYGGVAAVVSFLIVFGLMFMLMPDGVGFIARLASAILIGGVAAGILWFMTVLSIIVSLFKR